MISILFARADSNYKKIPGCDVWDIERDARNYIWLNPVVAHPPCRAWGRLRKFAKPRQDEMDLARFAVETVRKNGGVLEHPASSTLWIDQTLPLPGKMPDDYGGWSMEIDQFHFGHKARKRTWLYIVGCNPDDLPAIPVIDAEPMYCVGQSRSKRKRGVALPEISKKEREHTPIDFANWLVDVAGKCAGSRQKSR